MLFETVGRFYTPARTTPPSDGSAGFSPLQPANEKSRESAPSSPTPAEANRPEVSAAEERDLPSIAGLDAQDGLSRVAGNRKLYRKILRQFVEQQGPSLEQIAAALVKGDVALAERLAHTLKGVAGNIGAKTVQAAAGDVGEADSDLGPRPPKWNRPCSRPPPRSIPCWPNCRPRWTRPRPHCRAAVRRGPDGGGPRPVSRSGGAVDRLLSEFDSGAVEFLEANRRVAPPAVRRRGLGASSRSWSRTTPSPTRRRNWSRP